MSRRTHRKSRLGCAKCKQRHIKCDETRPVCVNCKSSTLSCSFNGGSVTSHAGVSRNLTPADSRSKSRGASSSTLELQHPPSTQFLSNVEDVNLEHMALFHHFFRETYKTILPGPFADDYCRAVTSCAVLHPYLMYSTLCLSSFHLSKLRPDQETHYKLLAITFQGKALKDINTIIGKVNAENCLAIALFSQHIGLHSFIDVFSNTAPDRSFNTFLDSFIQTIRLMRGITVIMVPWWSALLETDIGRMLAESRQRYDPHKSGTETLALRQKIEGANLTEDDRSTYLESIDSLQQHCDSNRDASREILGTPHTTFAWLITGKDAYLALLEERRPEALVILGFYAVVLHHHRKSWAIGNAGRVLLESIHQHLGRHWESWLDWPEQETSRE